MLYSPRQPAPPPPTSARLASTVTEKMRTEILREYVVMARRSQKQQQQQDREAQQSAASVDYHWSDIVSEAARRGKAVHSEGDLRRAVRDMCGKFSRLPSDAPTLQELSFLVISSARGGVGGASSPRGAQQQTSKIPLGGAAAAAASGLPVPSPRKHVLDITAKERLGHHGTSLFPPLQKQTPRSCRTHENFCTATADELLTNERKLAAKAPVHMPYLAHHFGKANYGSSRRKRNLAAIHMVESECGFVPPEQATSDDVLERHAKGHLTGGQISTLTSTRSRYGLHFTTPPELDEEARAVAGGSGASDEQRRMLLISDALMDRLREKEMQKRTRAALDREKAARDRVLERRRAEYDVEVESRRQSAEEIAADKERSAQRKVERREQQRAMADELRRAETLRQRRFEEAQAAKERYAAFAKEQNELELQREQAVAAAKRRRRVAASQANVALAESRRERDVKARERVLELEREVLAWQTQE